MASPKTTVQVTQFFLFHLRAVLLTFDIRLLWSLADFVLFLTVCGMGYFVFDRHRRGLPIELPAALSSRLPFGGAPTSRFARRPHTGFVSDYNLISPEDNSLQLSSNLT